MSSRISNNRTSVEIDTNLQDFYTSFLDTVAPNLKRVLDETLKKIEKDARKDWPVRQPIEITDSEGNVVSSRSTTQNSWRNFERGFRIVQGGGIEGYLRNRAPYAWAIRFGVNSVNNQKQAISYPTGKRVATELMIKPQQSEADAVVKALADDIIKRL